MNGTYVLLKLWTYYTSFSGSLWFDSNCTSQRNSMALASDIICTCSVGLIKSIQEKVDRAVKWYRATRGYLINLGKYLTKVGWEDNLRPLLDEDICAPDEEDSSSEGRRSFTWIWRMGSVSGNDSVAQEGEKDSI